MMPKGVYPHTHMKPKAYPPDVVERVRHLYFDLVMTQVEVASEMGTTQKVVHKIMRNHGMTTRPQAKRNQLGARNTAWKGDNAGYQACHTRVYNRRGKASEYLCEVCEKKRAQDWANLTGNYPDPSDYAAMCRSCHRTFDRKMARVEGVVSNAR